MTPAERDVVRTALLYDDALLTEQVKGVYYPSGGARERLVLAVARLREERGRPRSASHLEERRLAELERMWSRVWLYRLANFLLTPVTWIRATQKHRAKKREQAIYNAIRERDIDTQRAWCANEPMAKAAE